MTNVERLEKKASLKYARIVLYSRFAKRKGKAERRMVKVNLQKQVEFFFIDIYIDRMKAKHSSLRARL